MPPSSAPLVSAFQLHLQPPAGALRYKALLKWEAYTNGDYQLTTITKKVTLQVQPIETGYVFDFRTDLPVLTKSEDLEALEELALRLSALYEHVMLAATPAGEVVALLNHEAVQHTWAQLSQDLRASAPSNDPMTHTLLGFMDQQLQSPAAFLNSLRHDYLYQTLVPPYYGQPLGKPDGLGRSRQFTNFFDKIDLWFTEQASWEPGSTPAQLILRLHGTLDAQQTNVEVVRNLIAKALSLVPPSVDAPVEVPLPHFHYAATYLLEISTGLPLSVELGVYTRAGLVYNKEYTLTLARQ